MYGISTAWRSNETDDGNELIDLMLESGISSLELDYRITYEMLAQMKRRLFSGEITVLTIHNFCPIPQDIPKSKASGDLFLFSSLDEDERKLAVKYGLESIHLAADLEAGLVVYHFGTVDMEDEMEKLMDFYRAGKIDSEEATTWLTKKLAERQEKARPYFDAVLKSLDTLNKEAFRLGVLIGAENRYRYTQFPFKEEFDYIFREFAGGNIRYWHDVGHAEIFERLGLLDHEKDLLQRYKDHLAGMHIHDILGVQDHLAPGHGDFRFEKLAPYLNDQSIRILEVHSQASADDMRESVDLLMEKNILP